MTEADRLLAGTKRLGKENPDPVRQRDGPEDKLKERTQQYYAVASGLEEERGKNKYVDEVNYDGTVKALAFLLGNECAGTGTGIAICRCCAVYREGKKGGRRDPAGKLCGNNSA